MPDPVVVASGALVRSSASAGVQVLMASWQRKFRVLSKTVAMCLVFGVMALGIACGVYWKRRRFRCVHVIGILWYLIRADAPGIEVNGGRTKT